MDKELSHLNTENWETLIDLSIPSQKQDLFTGKSIDNFNVELFLKSKGHDPKLVFTSEDEALNCLLEESLKKVIIFLKKLFEYNRDIFKCNYCESPMEYPESHLYPVCPNQCEGHV